MERGLVMFLHSVIIGFILYGIMIYVFKQQSNKAENRSILLAACSLIYMILFGHSMPNKMNPI